MFENIKYDIYQKLGNYFPSYFKNKAFAKIKHSLTKDSNENPLENELLILHLFLDKNSTIIDVGANNGLYCYYFQEVINCKKIIAFEPIPSLFKKLNIWFNNIDFFPYAISDINSITTLNIPYINDIKYETRAKLNSIKEKGETKVKKIQIETKTIDSIFLNKKNKIDFIKIDIEGHELSAIRGASELLKRDNPILMIEIEARHHLINFNSIISEINSIGYECFFFNKTEKELMPFSNFNLEIHQNLNSLEKIYINNFLFFPINYDKISLINEKIKYEIC
jgi:FkbM family methyltransferase